jgi:hypothetical protein
MDIQSLPIDLSRQQVHEEEQVRAEHINWQMAQEQSRILAQSNKDALEAVDPSLGVLLDLSA